MEEGGSNDTLDRPRSTSALAPYIEKTYYGNTLPIGRREVFDRGICHYSPALHRDSINRILVYAGSFNPPHRGHSELLNHGYRRSGRDLNIRAAIILPLDDESLASKLRGQRDAIIFTKAERAALWNPYTPSDWFWVYEGSTKDWHDFQARLTQAINRDGFEIEWIALCGPDYVEVNRIPPPIVWGCKGLIVSDVGRPADFTERMVNSLKTLNGCQPWVETPADLQALRDHAQGRISWFLSGAYLLTPDIMRRVLKEDPEMPSRMIDELLDDDLEIAAAIRTCHRKNHPESFIRFVPMETQIPDISSTRVRRLLKSGASREDMLRELQHMVRYPEVLLDLYVHATTLSLSDISRMQYICW